MSGTAPSGFLYAASYATRIATLAIGFAVGVVGARTLGAEGRGAYAALLVGVGLMVQVTNAGISTALGYAVARRPRRLAMGLSTAFACAGVAVCAAAAVAAATRGLFGALAPLAAAWVGVQFVQTQQERLLYSCRKYVEPNVLLLGGRVAALAAAVAAWALRPLDLRAFAAGQLLAETLTAVAGFVLLRRIAGKWRWAPWKLLAAGSRVALRAFPSLLLPFLLLRSDILLLDGMRGPRETGLYSVAVQIVDVLLLLPASLSSMLFPSLFTLPDPAGYTARVTARGTALLALLALAVGLVSPVAVPRFFGESFREAWKPCVLLLPGAVLLGGQTLLSQFFMKEGVPLFLAAYWAAGLALNVGLNVALIPTWGASGAAMSSSIAYALVAALMFGRFRRLRRERPGALA